MGVALHLNKLEFRTPKDALCHIWLKLAQWFWRRSENVKSLQTDEQTNNGQTDDGQQLGDQKSSLELPAQMSLKKSKNERVENILRLKSALWRGPR